MSKYTIKDLSDGRVAAIHDGTLQQLKDVINLAAPGCGYDLHGWWKYYIVVDGKVKSSDRAFEGLFAQSVADFLAPLTEKEETKSDCSRHLKSVAGISDMKALANQIGDLHYETLAELLDFLAYKIQSDSHKDTMGGRIKLAVRLHSAYNGVRLAQHNIKKAWQISKPFMKDTPPLEAKEEALLPGDDGDVCHTCKTKMNYNGYDIHTPTSRCKTFWQSLPFSLALKFALST